MTLLFPILSKVILIALPGKFILYVTFCLIFLVIMMAATAYRLKNIGWMAGYAWIYLIPYFNIPLIYYCCHLPMNYVVDGRLDLAGKTLRIVFLILVLLPALVFQSDMMILLYEISKTAGQ